MQADATQLLCLKDLLNKFADSTGLKVNFNRSSIIPINVADSKMATLVTLLVVRLDPCLSHIWAYLWGLLNKNVGPNSTNG
jgi:hypothetical protein